ncbi:WYL domain-containing protein [Providencia stuartii]|nr:WYL domain-containing protein [Providencia stuartii]MTC18593.1 WYL domain-containing protein [Providencia stuartii]RMA17116.1 WYL domain-containing protein [Providencia stuartii]
MTPPNFSGACRAFLSISLCHHRLSAHYLTDRGTPFSPVMPYQLIYREGQWYLLAEYHQKVHVFLLEDIQSVKPLSSTFIPQKNINQLSQQNSFIAALPHFRLISQLLMPLISTTEG